MMIKWYWNRNTGEENVYGLLIGRTFIGVLRINKDKL